jgi:hypothetical protein
MNAVRTQLRPIAGPANYPTLFGVAFHPIKGCMERALRCYENLEEIKWKWNASTDADVLRESESASALSRTVRCPNLPLTMPPI